MSVTIKTGKVRYNDNGEYVEIDAVGGSGTAVDPALSTLSENPVQNKAIAVAINALQSGKQSKLTFDSTPMAGSTNPVTSDGVAAAMAEIDGEVSELNLQTVANQKKIREGITTDFYENQSYTAGQVVFYQNNLYRFLNNHTGSWNWQDVTMEYNAFRNIDRLDDRIDSSNNDINTLRLNINNINNDVTILKTNFSNLPLRAGTGTQSTQASYGCTASGDYSFAEGEETIASFEGSHAEGVSTKSMAYGSHAEGIETEANGDGSHAEGYQSKANSQYNHAEGYQTISNGHFSHTEGNNTIAACRSQHVFGEFNIEDITQAPEMDPEVPKTERGNFVEIVGNGTGESARSNARTLDWSGNEALAGSLTLGKGTADEVTISAAQLKQLLGLLT